MAPKSTPEFEIGASHQQESLNPDMLIDRLYSQLRTDEFEEGYIVSRIASIVSLVFPRGSADPWPEYVEARIRDFIKPAHEQMTKLRKIPLVEQRSPEWYAMRQKIVTASDFAQALGDGKFGTQLDFFKKKAGYEPEKPLDMESCAPLKWGCMFEDAACAIYEMRNATKVHLFGLLEHPSVGFFGASPDGISDQGVMVEIKCPFRRKITGEIPYQYYYQIQGQLDVCGLKECDFLECKFDVHESVDSLVDGCVLPSQEIGVVIDRASAGFVHSPVFFCTPEGISGLRNWVNANAALLPDEDDEQHAKPDTVVTWSLEQYSVVRTYKDDAFVRHKLTQLAEVWDRVELYRRDKTAYDRDLSSNTQGF